MRMMPVELVIFDCDGVLIDSEAIANEVCAEHVKELGLKITMQQFAADYAGSPIKDIWRRVEQRTGRVVTPEFRSRVDDEVHRRFAMDLRSMDGITDLLHDMAIRKCVASSTGLVKLKKNLSFVGLHDHFDPGIFSATQVARGKPSPDVFLYAASQMGADPAHCLVIEDSFAGVAAAGRAGMRVIGFSGGGHTLPDHGDRLINTGALQVAASMVELGKIMRSSYQVIMKSE